MEIKIRRAKNKDLRELTILYIKFYNDIRGLQGWSMLKPDEMEDEVLKYIERDVVYVADKKGKLIGFIRIVFREGAHWLEELYVEPIYRRRGIGSKLVDKAEEYIFERSDGVYIMVLPQHTTAITFWIKRGYTFLNTIELAKYKETEDIETYRIPYLRYTLHIFKWSRELYNELEKDYLNTLQRFYGRGYTSEDYMRLVTQALKKALED